MNQPWQCECGRKNKANAWYCGDCGSPWQSYGGSDRQQKQEKAPWQREADRWSQSPRRRVSPRRRKPPDGGAKGKPKGEGKGSQQKGKATTLAPDIAALPPPPTSTTVVLPKAPGTGPSQQAPEGDKKLLAALVAHMEHSEETPIELATMISHYREENHRVQGKTLHRLVSQQTEAKSALEKARADRQAYDSAWAQYVANLATLFQKQLEERQKVISQLEEAESSWETKLQDASALLSRTAGAGNTKDEVVDVEEEVDAAAATDAASDVRKEQRASQMQEIERTNLGILQALNTAKDTALEGVARDVSRSPRRKQKDTEQEHVDEVPPKMTKTAPLAKTAPPLGPG